MDVHELIKPSTTPTSSRARQTLRDATCDLHCALDSMLVSRLLVGGELTRADYLAVLQATEQVFVSHEATARAALAASEPSFLRRFAPRTADLTQDIALLIGQPWQCSTPTIDINEPAAAVGALYVLEGSLVGGLMINQRLTRNSAWFEREPLRFHRVLKERAMTRWHAFLELIERVVADATSAARAEVSARATFHRFIDAFSGIRL